MKYTIIVECEDDWQLETITHAVKNKLKIESLYQDVFRRVLKHGEDQTECDCYERVWEKVSDHFEE
jgi:hypothetical protein